MFGAGGAIKMIAMLMIVCIVAGGLYYVSNLQANLAVSRENSKKLEDGLEQQQILIAKIQAEQQQIKQINNELNETIKSQTKDTDALKNRFAEGSDGKARDIGALAVKKPESIQRAVNKGTINALRCLEIASGAPLTEEEKNANTPSTINKECPSLANPNYDPAVAN